MAERDDVHVAGGRAGGVHRRLVGLGAAAGEERLAEIAGRDPCQLLGQVRLLLVGVQRGRVIDLADLLDHRRLDGRVTVADAHAEHAAEGV